MSSLKHQWILLSCLLVLSVMTGCSKTEELEKAVRRAERAEKTVSSLKQVQNELTANKKDLELQILELQQPGVTDVNDLLGHDVSQDMSEDMEGPEIEQLRLQLLQARADLKEKDKDIQELQDLVEGLASTVNQLQEQYDADAVLDDGAIQDPNLAEIDAQGDI